MNKHFNRVDKVISECKDIDRSAQHSSNVEDFDLTFKLGNHHMLRHIAINTALIVDMMDRLFDNIDAISVSDDDIADALIDAYMRRKDRDNNGGLQ